MSKIKRMIPYTTRWENLANQLARQWIQIYACMTCGHPVVVGYQCTFCGEANPEGDSDTRKEFYEWIKKEERSKKNE